MSLVAGKRGQFEVSVGDSVVAKRGGNWFTRSFGAGYPNPDDVIESVRSCLQEQS